MYPLAQLILPAKSSLQSHLQVSSFQICLLLHTDELNLHTHFQLSCHNTLPFSFNLIKKLQTCIFTFLMILGTHILDIGLSKVLQLPLHLFTNTLYR